MIEYMQWFLSKHGNNQFHSEHSFHEFIDFFFSVTPDTTIVIWMSLLFKSLLWRVELEWPEEVVCFFEVWSNSNNLVNEVLNWDDAEFTKFLFNKSIIGQWDSALVDFSITSLVDKLGDNRSWRVSISDVGFNNS